eukprot:TRINITY_DN1391_c1_g3_i4.p1 TRINITY_DN1391_c1_g3~~TRINITY_DN1391_c1_g3_i4.p1  ORF type:complete len:227 (+),score=32.69 TRINITY_DN1391_c1_g3_i4:49-729(+)
MRKKTMSLTNELAAGRIQGMYRCYKARCITDQLRKKRELALQLLMASPQVKKVGTGKYGLKWMFRAPGTKGKAALGTAEGVKLVSETDYSGGNGKEVHPDVPWLMRGLDVFYTKYNKEALPNVKKIAVTAAGHAQELREKLMKKYPTVPVYEFEWLRSTTPKPGALSRHRQRAATMLTKPMKAAPPSPRTEGPRTPLTPSLASLKNSFFSSDSGEVPMLSATQPLL